MNCTSRQWFDCWVIPQMSCEREAGSIISAEAGQTARVRVRGRAGVRERRGARSIAEHVAAAPISLANHFFPSHRSNYPLLSLLYHSVKSPKTRTYS